MTNHDKSRSQPSPARPPDVDPGTLWTSVTSEPNTGVTLLEPKGRVIYINRQATRIYFGEGVTPEDIIGRSLDELFPPQWVAERQAVFDRVQAEGKPILFRTIWRGLQHVAWVYPVRTGDDPDGPVTRLLVITRRGGTSDASTEDNNHFERVEARVIDLGELGALTPRELVVLALLGRGMSIKEVAEHLYRSEKTIQTQRDSISRKLNLRNRAELVRLVQNVGLTVEDAERTNVDGD